MSPFLTQLLQELSLSFTTSSLLLATTSSSRPIYNLKVDGYLEYHENAPLVLRAIVVSFGVS